MENTECWRADNLREELSLIRIKAEKSIKTILTNNEVSDIDIEVITFENDILNISIPVPDRHIEADYYHSLEELLFDGNCVELTADDWTITLDDLETYIVIELLGLLEQIYKK